MHMMMMMMMIKCSLRIRKRLLLCQEFAYTHRKELVMYTHCGDWLVMSQKSAMLLNPKPRLL